MQPTLKRLAARMRGGGTKAELAYQVIREGIMSGILAPTQRLMPAKIAADLEMSYIPIREALRRLSEEGLVTIKPYVGAAVADLPRRQLGELLLIRGHLEELAVEIAASTIGDHDIAALEKLLRRMDACVERDEMDEFGQLNRQFHLAIYEATPFQELSRMIGDLWDKASRARAVFSFDKEQAVRSQQEHRQLLEALRNRDAEVAVALTKGQKDRSRILLSTLEPDATDEVPV